MSERTTTIVGLIFIGVWCVVALAALAWCCVHGDGFEEREEIR